MRDKSYTLFQKKVTRFIEIVYPVHLNPNVQKTVYRILSNYSRIHLIAPLDYEPFVHLMKRCYLIITDSGGIQEEAPSLGKPVLVFRNETEREEAIAAGTAKLVGTSYTSILRNTQRNSIPQERGRKFRN